MNLDFVTELTSISFSKSWFDSIFQINQICLLSTILLHVLYNGY